MRTYLRVDIFEPRTITPPTHFPVRRKFQIFIISRTKHIFESIPYTQYKWGSHRRKKFERYVFSIGNSDVVNPVITVQSL